MSVPRVYLLIREIRDEEYGSEYDYEGTVMICPGSADPYSVFSELEPGERRRIGPEYEYRTHTIVYWIEAPRND